MTNEKEHTLELIEVYRSLPALWDVNCEDYSDRDKKEEQYNILLECYNRHNPEAQLSDLKKKINWLRTNFRRELKKSISLQRNGAGEYVTTLYYYDALSFLEDVITPVEPTSTLKDKDRTKSEKRKRRPSDEESFPENNPLQVEEYANHDTLKEWDKNLSTLDPTQKMLAEKVINEVFLNGHLGLLSLDTTLTQTSKQGPLNKHQFVQAFKHFLRTDDEFVEELHGAYRNLKHKKLVK